MLRTKLCDLLGIEQPIILASMGHHPPGPRLASAVSNAGGLGLLGGGGLDPQDLREKIHQTRQLTNKPFGVGLVFPARASEADGGWKLPNPLPEPVLLAREELRARGIEVDLTPPPPERDSYAGWRTAQERAKIVLEEKVPVLACGLGTPDWLVKEAHAQGTVLVSLVGSVKQAKRVEAMGADIIVAQGHENGGHVGKTPTFVLVPQVVDAVKVPVVATGGIADGRGLAAAIALGAVGVYMGTRFLATYESEAPEWHKQAVLNADENGTIYTRVYDGLGHRHLKTRFDELWQGHEGEILSFPHQRALMVKIYEASRKANIPDYTYMSAGMSSGLIHELKHVDEVIKEMVKQASAILGR